MGGGTGFPQLRRGKGWYGGSESADPRLYRHRLAFSAAPEPRDQPWGGYPSLASPAVLAAVQPCHLLQSQHVLFPELGPSQPVLLPVTQPPL